MAIQKTSDGSLVDDDGRVIVFSPTRFVRDIGEGRCCFICGAAPNTRRFNNEHVIPNWILRACDLHSQKITLPNENDLGYGNYTIPCCEECNSLMSDELETPVSRLIKGGYSAVADYVREFGPMLFFRWMALIFLKTHLKDKHLRRNLDPRRGTETIADVYEWEILHHIHCIARSFYTKAQIDPRALGTFLMTRCGDTALTGGFDYGDNYVARTLLLQIDEIAFVTVFNDSAICGILLESLLKSITGPVSPLQLREVMARLAYANMCLKTRPEFRSELFPDGTYIISAGLPRKVEMEPVDAPVLGKLFYSIAKTAISEAQADELSDQIRSGKWTYIVDSDGRFINHFANGQAKDPNGNIQ